MEVKIDSEFVWVNFTIDTDTGLLIRTDKTHSYMERKLSIAPQFDMPIPQWSEIIELAIKAHQSIGDIRTVAWDLCVTSEGATLIEGNTSWGIVSIQVETETPILRSRINDSYSI